MRLTSRSDLVPTIGSQLSLPAVLRHLQPDARPVHRRHHVGLLLLRRLLREAERGAGVAPDALGGARGGPERQEVEGLPQDRAWGGPGGPLWGQPHAAGQVVRHQGGGLQASPHTGWVGGWGRFGHRHPHPGCPTLQDRLQHGLSGGVGRVRRRRSVQVAVDKGVSGVSCLETARLETRVSALSVALDLLDIGIPVFSTPPLSHTCMVGCSDRPCPKLSCFSYYGEGEKLWARMAQLCIGSRCVQCWNLERTPTKEVCCVDNHL